MTREELPATSVISKKFAFFVKKVLSSVFICICLPIIVIQGLMNFQDFKHFYGTSILSEIHKIFEHSCFVLENIHTVAHPKKDLA